MEKESEEWPGLLLPAWLGSLWICFSVGSVDNKDPRRGGAWPDELSLEPTTAVERPYTTSLFVQAKQSIVIQSNTPLCLPSQKKKTGYADI